MACLKKETLRSNAGAAHDVNWVLTSLLTSASNEGYSGLNNKRQQPLKLKGEAKKKKKLNRKEGLEIGTSRMEAKDRNTWARSIVAE